MSDQLLVQFGALQNASANISKAVNTLHSKLSDLESAVSRLRAAGVEVAEPVPAAGGGRVASFKDPEGNVLQVVERPGEWPPI